MDKLSQLYQLHLEKNKTKQKKTKKRPSRRDNADVTTRAPKLLPLPREPDGRLETGSISVVEVIKVSETCGSSVIMTASWQSFWMRRRDPDRLGDASANDSLLTARPLESQVSSKE